MAVKSLNLKANILLKKYQVTGNIDFLDLAQKSTDIINILIVNLRKPKTDAQEQMNLLILSDQSNEVALKIQYELYTKLKNEKHIGNIFEIAERNKSSNLYWSILDNHSKKFSDIPNDLLKKEVKLKNDISILKTKLLMDIDDLQKRSIDEKIFQLKMEHEKLIETFSNLYPKYHQLKYLIKTISIQELQNQLLNKNQSLVEYFLADSSLYIFAITKNNYEVKKVAIDSIFHAYFDRFRKQLQSPKLTSQTKNDFNHYTVSAHTLYQYLLAPIADLIKEKDLIIVPDDKLALIPFGVLLTSNSQQETINYKMLPYVLKSHTISYANSATTLLNNSNRINNKKSIDRILAFAPSFENKLMALTEPDTVRSALGPLGWTKQEINSLTSYFDTDLYVGASATEKVFKEKAEHSKIIHIASHGLVDDQNPMYSKIAFTLDKQDTLNDGYLHTFELYNTQLNAEMVVLSACNTGYGKVQKGRKPARMIHLLSGLWLIDENSCILAWYCEV